MYLTLTVASKFAGFESSLLQSMRNIAREVFKVYLSLIWTKWNSDRERTGPSWIVVIAAAIPWRRREILQFSDACFVHLLSQYFYTL